MAKLIAGVDVVSQGVLVYFHDGRVALLSEDHIFQLAVSLDAFGTAKNVESDMLLEHLTLLPFNTQPED